MASSKEHNISAADKTAFNLKHEDKMRDKLNPHFKSLGKYAKKYYAENGQLPSLDKHQEKLQSIIADHYRDVAHKTSKSFRSDYPIKNDAKVQSIIDSQIEVDADDRADFSAGEIIETTNNNFRDSIRNSIIAAAIGGVVLSNTKIADDLSNDFDSTIDDRIDLISQNETTIASHDGQFDELDALSDTNAEFEDGTNYNDYRQEKTWVAIIDDHTREEHMEADGQVVPVDEPFIVGGEPLMYPGDDSLGAGLWNIIGCRCRAIINTIKK